MALSMSSKLPGLPTYSSVSISRLKSLYSDFSRQKVSNPASFNSNVEWWKRTLSALVEQGMQKGTSDVLILHASSEISESLRYEGAGKPLGLAAVLTELKYNQSLIPLRAFMNAKTSIYYPGSLVYRVTSYVVGKPLWWALEQLNLVDSDKVMESETTLWKKIEGRYIVVGSLEKAADAVIKHQELIRSTSLADSLYSFESFKAVFGKQGALLDDVSLSDDDIRVLLKYLERDRRVIVSDREVIKFVDESSESITSVITAVDRGILELKGGVENTEKQIEQLQKRIDGKTQKISECLRSKHREVAMSHLKSRKQLEEVLKKRLRSLEILQSTLIQVEAAAQDVEIMKQYESSTTTLRAILSHPSLQREKIDQTMEAMAEATADQREIDETIRLGMGAASGEEIVDEQELESELAGLVEEVQEEEREKQELRTLEAKQREQLVLPSAPVDAVGEGAAAMRTSPEFMPLPQSSASLRSQPVREVQPSSS